MYFLIVIKIESILRFNVTLRSIEEIDELWIDRRWRIRLMYLFVHSLRYLTQNLCCKVCEQSLIQIFLNKYYLNILKYIFYIFKLNHYVSFIFKLNKYLLNSFQMNSCTQHVYVFLKFLSEVPIRYFLVNIL